MINPKLYGEITESADKDLSLENPFIEAIDRIIQKRVDEIIANEPSAYKLITEKNRRIQLEHELRKSTDYSEFHYHIAKSISILQKEGLNYLSKNDYLLLMREINQLRKSLKSADLPSNEFSFHNVFTLPSTCLELIKEVSIAKYTGEFYNETLSLMALLSILEPSEPDHYYRLGCVAQKCERYDLAIKAFLIAEKYAPEFIGSHIFASQCYFSCHRLTEAKAELLEAKKILKTLPNEKEWAECCEELEMLLAA